MLLFRRTVRRPRFRTLALRTIAHISDLHFGRLNAATLPALAASILAAKPDVVVVSGDLTQRARGHQFADARRFLDTLPRPQIVVPGNHDVPLYNVFARWLSPLTKYRRYLGGDIEPFFADDEIAVLGINTARSLTFKNGRINMEQVTRSCARLQASAHGATRVLVAHHPFDTLETKDAHNIVGRADMAMAEFARCQIDMILTGHLHASGVSDSTMRYKIPGYSALFVQAGTATSSRQRGEVNSWNLIRIERPRIAVDRLHWDSQRNDFQVSNTEHFQLGSAGWSRAGTDFPPADDAR